MLQISDIMVYVEMITEAFENFWELANTKVAVLVPFAAAMDIGDATVIEIMIGASLGLFVTLTLAKWIIGVIT